jgi:hypothetical protein
MLSVFAIATLSSCGEGQSGVGPRGSIVVNGPTPAPLLLEPPSGSIYLGMYVNPLLVNHPPTSLIAGFEQQVGRKMAVSMHYYGFYDKFPAAYEADDEANGRIPLDSWDCQLSNADVAAGKVDGTLALRAQAIKAFGKPIFLRYMWEMNIPATTTYRSICYDPATDLPNGTFSPQNYIAAWDRIRAIFAQQGVTNVVWLWNPDGDRNPSAYYPGNSEVDWTGFDFYDLSNVPPLETYLQAYRYLAPYAKPIMVGETGAQPPLQTSFFSQLAPTLQASFPLIKGYMYFDSANKIQSIQQVTWVIGPDEVSEFAAFANSSYMSAYQPQQ